MPNWTRRYSSQSNTQTQPITLVSLLLFFCLPDSVRAPLIFLCFHLGREKKGRVKECNPDTPSSACSDRQAQYSPSRFLACHSNLLDPLSNRQTPCRTSGFYAYMHAYVTVGVFRVTKFGMCSNHAALIKNKTDSVTHAPPTYVAPALFSVRGASPAATELHMTHLCFAEELHFVS